MVIIASTIVTGYVTRVRTIACVENDARLVNIAGRQRMLSQRIAVKSAVLAHAVGVGQNADAERAADELREACSIWRDSHAMLVHHYAGGDAPGETETAPEIAGLLCEMTPVQSRVLERTDALLGVIGDGQPTTGSTMNRDLFIDMATIMEGADEYLPMMDATVAAIERRAGSKLASYQATQLGLLIGTLSVIVLACVFVFEPLVRWHSVMTDRLRGAADEAEEGSRAKTAFLANMSHEIRTPMTAIIGYSKLIADDPDPNVDSLGEWSRTIETNARHLLGLINDILDVSKIEAGRMAIESIETDPAVIIEETVSLLRLQASKKRIGLRIEYESPIPARIVSDPGRLRQILINIAGNAVKFTSEGVVTLRVSCDQKTELLTLTVEDTGIGLTDEQLDKIRRFESFTQADASTTREYGGTGLGLKLCNTLIGLMGGTLEIESVIGEGSRFRVELPTGPLGSRTFRRPDRIVRDVAAGRHEGADDGRALEGVRVLVVEDGADNQRLFGHFLGRAGSDLRIVGNGAEAVKLFEEGADWIPDVVLMDMQMPVLDGYGATRRLRKLGVSTPIVALTANAMLSDRKACLDAGCDDYLSKPVDRGDLIAMCVSWSQRSRRSAA